MSRPVKEWLSDIYKSKLCLGYILEFLRELDMTGEWGRNIKEISLVEFQQWIWKRIPNEEDEQYNKPFSTNQNTLDSRRKRKNKKEKQDYERLLREMREKIKKS